MNSNQKILLLGASGRIGKYFWRQSNRNPMVGTYSDHYIAHGVHFDVQKNFIKSVISDIDQFSHALVLIGETDAELLAQDSSYAIRLNKAIMKTIDMLIVHKICIVFASSDWVFDGTKGNYTETDLPNPIFMYGKLKYEIEKYIETYSKKYIIVRFGKTYSDNPDDHTLFTQWITQLLSNDHIVIASDQTFSPIWVGDVVTAVLALIEKDACGIYHVAGPTSYSRKELFDMTVKCVNTITKTYHSVTYQSIDQFPLLEKRPHDVSLCIDKLISTSHFKPKDAHDMCKKIVNHYFL